MIDSAFIPALEQQLDCYRKLARLADSQRELVLTSRTELLLELLQKRQQVLDELARTEVVVSPVRKSWASCRDGASAAECERAEMLFAETRSLLEQITASDREDVLVLQQQKLNLGKQLNQNASARQVNRSYAGAAYGAKTSSVDFQR